MKNKIYLFVLGSFLAAFFVLQGSTPLAHADTYCTINAFYSSAQGNPVSNGQNVVLSWVTSGCNYVTIGGGSFNPNDQRVPSGSTPTETLLSSVTYTLYAYGSNTVSMPLPIVVGNPYMYSVSAITSVATNVDTTNARLNGIITVPSSYGAFTTYFEYGDTPSLGYATVFKTNSSTASPGTYDTVYNLVPNKTYYYRIVGRLNDRIVQGNTLSFKTLSDVAPVSTSTNTSNSNQNSNTSNSNPFAYLFGSSSNTPAPTASGEVTLTVTNPSDKIFVGDTVEYTITYTNGTNKTLSNAVLSIVFPDGFAAKQTTQGVLLSPTSMSINLGTIVPGKTASIFAEAVAASKIAINQTLVTTATLSYSLPNGKTDSTIGYALNHASVQNIFAGFALGTGFFPSTIFGWFFTAIIILIIILLARRIARAKMHHGEHGGHGDEHAPKH